MAKKSAKPLTKTEILNSLAEASGLSRKEVSSVMDALEDLITKSIKGSAGVFNLAGLVKVYVHTRPASKERMGRNPATGEEMLIKAKPATKVIKARPLKKLKDLI